MNSLSKTVTRQCHGCDLNLGPSVPESSTLTTQLPFLLKKLHFLSTEGSVATKSLCSVVWNRLPTAVHITELSLNRFHRELKTLYFSRAYLSTRSGALVMVWGCESIETSNSKTVHVCSLVVLETAVLVLVLVWRDMVLVLATGLDLYLGLERAGFRLALVLKDLALVLVLLQLVLTATLCVCNVYVDEGIGAAESGSSQRAAVHWCHVQRQDTQLCHRCVAAAFTWLTHLLMLDPVNSPFLNNPSVAAVGQKLQTL